MATYRQPGRCIHDRRCHLYYLECRKSIQQFISDGGPSRASAQQSAPIHADPKAGARKRCTGHSPMCY
jgi:hypothetical protein